MSGQVNVQDQLTAAADEAQRLRLAPSFFAPGSEQLSASLRQGKLGDFEATSDIAACLMPLLAALKWRGELHHLAEAMPHFANTLTLTGLRNVLANLDYVSKPAKARLDRIDARLMPCLFVPDDGAAMVLLSAGKDGIQVFDGGEKRERTVPADTVSGTAYFLSPADQDEAKPSSWMGQLLHRFRPVVRSLYAVTFFINILAVITPLFIMTLYDKVVPTKDYNVLVLLASGVAFALLCEFGLRAVRARMLAYLGARMDYSISTASLKQILFLPPTMTERAPLGGQVSRLREFDSLRDFFTGPLAGVALELPFVVLLIGVVAILGGPLAFVPIGLIIAFALTGLLLFPAMKRAAKNASQARSERQAFLVDSLSHLRAIKLAAAEDTWIERYQKLSAASAFGHYKLTQMSSIFQTLAHTLMLISGVATIGFGAMMIMAGDLTVGAMIAVVALTWRILAPINMAFLTFTRVEQVRAGVDQLNRLMRMPTEVSARGRSTAVRRFAGHVSLQRVSLRYTPEAEPALFGVSVTVKPREVLAILGPSGSGKSSVLKCIAGLYQPQAGNISVDGLDIRQIAPGEWRRTIAYLPQAPQFFHGTLAQNIRLANPVASDDDILKACERAAVARDILALPDGFNTRIGDQKLKRLPTGFLQRLALARVYLRNAPIVLFDEAAEALDDEGDAALVAAIQDLRKTATVIMVTHRPSHAKLADRVIAMDAGMVVAAGTPEELLPKIYGGR